IFPIAAYFEVAARCTVYLLLGSVDRRYKTVRGPVWYPYMKIKLAITVDGQFGMVFLGKAGGLLYRDLTFFPFQGRGDIEVDKKRLVIFTFYIDITLKLGATFYRRSVTTGKSGHIRVPELFYGAR